MPFEPRVYKDKPDRSTPVRAADAAHWQTQYAAAMADAAELFGASPVATTGHKYRLVSCALRNSGSGWGFIQDANHEPIGVSGVTISGGMIRIAFNFTATRVGDLTVTPDETFVLQGIGGGPSVGLDSASIQLAKAGGCFDYVSWNGTSWDSATGFVTSTSMNGTTGVITFNHEEVSDSFGGQVQLRTDGTNRMTPGSMSSTVMQATVFPYNSSTSVKTPSTDMRFFISRTGARKLAPASVVSASGNLWVSGLFEVA